MNLWRLTIFYVVIWIWEEYSYHLMYSKWEIFTSWHTSTIQIYNQVLGEFIYKNNVCYWSLIEEEMVTIFFFPPQNIVISWNWLFFFFFLLLVLDLYICSLLCSIATCHVTMMNAPSIFLCIHCTHISCSSSLYYCL